MPNIKHVFHIKSNFDEVFKYFSTIDGLKQWWTPDVSGGEKAGEVITFGFGSEGSASFEIMECEPNEHMRWHYRGEENDEWQGTKIILHLSENEGKVRVDFQHNGFRNNNDFYGECNYTWGRLLSGLKDLCEGGASKSF